MSRVALWFGLLGAAFAWALQEWVNVSLAGYACYPHDLPLAAPLLPHVGAITAWIGAAALAVCVGGFLAAFASWRKSRDERPGDAHLLLGSGDGRTRFMAMAGMMTSLLFLIATGLSVMNVAGISPCGG